MLAQHQCRSSAAAACYAAVATSPFRSARNHKPHDEWDWRELGVAARDSTFESSLEEATPSILRDVRVWMPKQRPNFRQIIILPHNRQDLNARSDQYGIAKFESPKRNPAQAVSFIRSLGGILKGQPFEGRAIESQRHRRSGRESRTGVPNAKRTSQGEHRRAR
jgi:hypothetical protein